MFIQMLYHKNPPPLAEIPLHKTNETKCEQISWRNSLTSKRRLAKRITFNNGYYHGENKKNIRNVHYVCTSTIVFLQKKNQHPPPPHSPLPHPQHSGWLLLWPSSAPRLLTFIFNEANCFPHIPRLLFRDCATVR